MPHCKAPTSTTLHLGHGHRLTGYLEVNEDRDLQPVSDSTYTNMPVGSSQVKERGELLHTLAFIHRGVRKGTGHL